jgi:hypothetical protein
MVVRRLAITVVLLLALSMPAAGELCGLCAGCPGFARPLAPACHEEPAASFSAGCCASSATAEPALPGAAPAQVVEQPVHSPVRRLESGAAPSLPAPAPLSIAAVPLFTLHSSLLI